MELVTPQLTRTCRLTGIFQTSLPSHPVCDVLPSLAVRYLFETNDATSSDSGEPLQQRPRLHVDSFQAKTARNDYEIPWALREVIGSGLFEDEWQQLAIAFNEWHPKTK
jgi:hypothetical protein